MHRSSNNFVHGRQSPSNIDNYKTLNDLGMKSPDSRTQRQLSPNTGTSNRLPPDTRITRQLSSNTETPRQLSSNTEIPRQLSPNIGTSHRLPPDTRTTRQLSSNTEAPRQLSPNTGTSHRLSPDSRTTRQLSPHTGTLHQLSPHTRTSRQLSTIENSDDDDDDDDDDNNNETLRKLMTRQSLNPSRSSSLSNTLLKSMIIDGQWKYRAHDDDKLRFKSMGIENLVVICHDIMKNTFESIHRKREKRSKSYSINDLYPVVKLDEFKKLTNTDRSSLRRAHVFELMTIVNEATLTNTSISQLVRIWREASEHNLKPHHIKPSGSQPLISYKQVFQHLIRTPNNQLLQIAAHASLISTHSRSDLKRLGEKLGIKRHDFDMNSIRDSTDAFQNFIKFLREQKLREKQEQQFIDIKRLPYRPKKKRGLCANVSGTKFRISKSTFLRSNIEKRILLLIHIKINKNNNYIT